MNFDEILKIVQDADKRATSVQAVEGFSNLAMGFVAFRQTLIENGMDEKMANATSVEVMTSMVAQMIQQNRGGK